MVADPGHPRASTPRRNQKTTDARQGPGRKTAAPVDGDWRSRKPRKSPGRKVVEGLARSGTVSELIGAVTDGTGATGAAPTWYLAPFSAATPDMTSRERAAGRYALRDGLQQISLINRLQTCGASIGYSETCAHAGEGTAYLSGVETCGSPHACPVCAAKIRAFRADEIVRGTRRFIEKFGGTILLVTLTFPHGRDDPLSKTRKIMMKAWDKLKNCRAYRDEREKFGILGYVLAQEYTHGANGWHPHLHALFFFDKKLSKKQILGIEVEWQRRWNEALTSLNWQTSLGRIGLRIDKVRGVTAAAKYIAKLQEGQKWDRNAANEMTSYLKEGRYGNRTPFQIGADALDTGNAADIDLWNEFEQATRGTSAVRWSKGLRDLLLPNVKEIEDREAAMIDAKLPVIARWDHVTHKRLRNIPYGIAGMLRAIELEGLPGARRWLRYLDIPTGGLRAPGDAVEKAIEDREKRQSHKGMTRKQKQRILIRVDAS